MLLLADGRFPAGGHACSAGVEAAVRVGDVIDAPTLERYLAGRLSTTGTTDAAFAVAAWAVVVGPAAVAAERMAVLDAEYQARVLSPNLRAVSRRLGRQLLRAARGVWPRPELDSVATLGGGAHQPLVLGAAVAAAGGAAPDAAAIAVHHLATAVTTAAVRLLGLDPITVAAVHARAVAASAATDDCHRWIDAHPSTLPALGGVLTEILGEHHATWDARLFTA